MTASLPVPAYHYISWRKDATAVTPERFAEQLEALTREGWRGISLAEAAEYLFSGRSLPDKSLLITFDGGFLDNYVYAYPLLKEYGHKAVIFVVSHRLETAGPLRPTLDDVRQGNIRQEDLPRRLDDPFFVTKSGLKERRDPFITFDEARWMLDDGVMDIASFSAQHRLVYAGPKHKGFLSPRHQAQPFEAVAAPAPYGLPAFQTGPELATRAWTPSERLVELVRSEVPQEPKAARAHLIQEHNIKRLKRALEGLPKDEWGAFESQRDYTERVRGELSACKELLESEFARRPAATPQYVLAWPWGASTPEAEAVARELGYTVFFTSRPGANPPGRPAAVRRFEARDKPGSWLVSRLQTFANPLKARLTGALS